MIVITVMMETGCHSLNTETDKPGMQFFDGKSAKKCLQTVNHKRKIVIHQGIAFLCPLLAYPKTGKKTMTDVVSSFLSSSLLSHLTRLERQTIFFAPSFL